MLTPRKICAAVLAAILACGSVAADQNDDFWLAVRRGDLKTVEELLAKGVDVNTKFRYGATALSYACDRGHLEVVKALLARGAEVNVRDTFYGASPLTWAVSKGHIEIVKLLLEKGASGRDDALMSTAFNRRIEIARVILDAGGLKPETLSAALARATSTKNEAFVELLKKHGAKPVEDKIQLSPEALKAFEGTYRGEGVPDFVLTVVDGRLVAAVQGQKVSLSPETPTTFRAVEFPAISWIFDVQDGKTTGATFRQGNNNTRMTRQEPAKQ
jgi:hypothetical protein